MNLISLTFGKLPVFIAEFVPDNQKTHCKHDTQLIGDSKINLS